MGLPGQRPSALPAGRHLAVPASWKGGLDRQVDWSLAPCPAGRWTWSAHPTPRPEACSAPQARPQSPPRRRTGRGWSWPKTTCCDGPGWPACWNAPVPGRARPANWSPPATRRPWPTSAPESARCWPDERGRSHTGIAHRLWVTEAPWQAPAQHPDQPGPARDQRRPPPDPGRAHPPRHPPTRPGGPHRLGHPRAPSRWPASRPPMAPADSAPQAVIDDQTPHHKPRIAAQDTGAHTASRKLMVP